MCFLATAAAQDNAAEYQQESERQRNDVAEAGEDGRRIGGRRQDRLDDTGSSPRQRLHDIAAPVDDSTDPRWRGAEDRNAFLRRSKPRLGEVLRGPPAAEPRVIRWVEDEAGTIFLVDDMT